MSRGPKWKIEVYFFPLKNEPTLYLTFLGVYALTIQKQKPYIVHLLKTFFNDSFAQKIKKNNSLSRGPKWKIEVNFFPWKREPTLYRTFLGAYDLTIQKQKPYIVYSWKTFFNDNFAQKGEKNQQFELGFKVKVWGLFLSMKKGTHFISDLPGCVWFNYLKTKTIHCILMKNIFQWQVCSKGKKKPESGSEGKKWLTFVKQFLATTEKNYIWASRQFLFQKKKKKKNGLRQKSGNSLVGPF